MGLALLIVLIRPQFLTVAEVGFIGYVNGMISFFSSFFSFGLDNSGARLIINQQDDERKSRMAGTMMFLALALCLVFSLFMAIAGIFVPYFGRSEAVPLLYLVLPFAGYNILLIFFNSNCYALGRIKLASVQMFIFQIIYLPLMLLMRWMDVYGLETAIFSEYAIHMLVLLIPIFIFDRKYLKNHKDLWPDIKEEQKNKGWKIYMSRVMFLPTFNMDTLILGAFHPMESVSYYTLTNTITRPITIIGQSISQSMYRKYANQSCVSKKQITYLSLLSAAVSVTGFIGCHIVIRLFLGESYLPMLAILPFSIGAAFVRGISSIYVSFMTSKGLADETRKCAIAGMVANIVFNFALIIPFGAIGGMYASIIVLLINLGMRMHYCAQYARNNCSA